MGFRADLIKTQAPEIRKLFYNDDHYCKDVETYSYDRYISDNANNLKVIENAMTKKEITLMVSPTGSGKSRALIQAAKEVVKKSRDCKVFIAIPTRALTEQVGKTNSSIWILIGGKRFYKNGSITAVTYDKLYDVQEYIKKEKAAGNKGKYVLILDECHFLVSQHKFRQAAIMDIISGIEKNLYDSVLLVTATSAPMPLFRCDKCIEFESKTYKPVMDKIKIVYTDDVLEYIKNKDLNTCFPFIRLNDTEKISELKKQSCQFHAKLTSEEKSDDIYDDMVNRCMISSKKYQGILATSFVEVGINITSYPDNMVMIAAFDDWNMSVDSIEQFFNRARRTDTQHIEYAEIVLPKLKENTACLLDGDDNEICIFHDLIIEEDSVCVCDTGQMNGLPDGRYKIKLKLNGGTKRRNLEIQSHGTSGNMVYCKDSQPVVFYNTGFRSFVNILKSNYKLVYRFRDILQSYVNDFEDKRKKNKILWKLGDDDMDAFELDDQKLIETMTKAGIEAQKELKECMEYKNGEIVINQRILFMLSYNLFQRQYLYHADKLKAELEARMKVNVTIEEADTAKRKIEYNRDDIWEGIEDVRSAVICDDGYYQAIIGRENNKYMSDQTHSSNIYKIRMREYLRELMKDLERVNISGECILKILTSSQSKGKVTKYKEAYILIVNNRMLEKYDGKDISNIPLYNKGMKDKLQVAVYCYLQQKYQATYKLTKELAEEIIAFYKKSYPQSTKLPTTRQVKSKLKMMYLPKGKDTIRGQLRISQDDIFKIVKPDYE